MTTGLTVIRERRLEIFQEGLGRLGGASGEEPVESRRDLFFGGFAQDAKDGRAVAIEDDGGGNDLAELEIAKSCRRSAGENRKRDFLFFEEARDFGLGLSVIERDGEEGHVLVLVSGGQFGEHHSQDGCPRAFAGWQIGLAHALRSNCGVFGRWRDGAQ